MGWYFGCLSLPAGSPASVARNCAFFNQNDFGRLATGRPLRKRRVQEQRMNSAMCRSCAGLRAFLIVVGTTCGLLVLAASAGAQVVNPADNPPDAAQPVPTDDTHHTWTMPAIEVTGKAPLIEEDRIGDYAQPRWTAHRRFSETRVYVIPRGMVDFEYWMIPKNPKDGPTDFKSQYEVEFGLPGRFQIDLYAVGHKTGTKDEEFSISEQK